MAMSCLSRQPIRPVAYQLHVVVVWVPTEAALGPKHYIGTNLAMANGGGTDRLFAGGLSLLVYKNSCVALCLSN